jgi:hypothetical protein
VSLLVLKREELFSAAEEFIELTEEIENATQYIIDYDTPIIDYTLGINHTNNWSSSNGATPLFSK